MTGIQLHSWILILCVLTGALGAACSLSGSPREFPADTYKPAAEGPPATATTSIVPSPSATPVLLTEEPTPTATLSPSPTLSPTSDPSPTPNPYTLLNSQLEAIVGSRHWPLPGLDAERAQRWETLALNGIETATKEETEQLAQFVRQWNTIHAAAAEFIEPKDAALALRVVEINPQTDLARPVVYAVVSSISEAPENEQIFLIGRDRRNNPIGLVAAPLIEGLVQQISSDGMHVEYVDPLSGSVLVSADAHSPDPELSSEKVLEDRLAELYRKYHPYVRTNLYPRYYFPAEGVHASFYHVENVLTYLQILRMHEAIELYERPELVPLKRAFLGKGIFIILEEDLGFASGLNYRGSSVIALDRRQLFGNRYDLAEVLAHEGAHTIQGWGGGDICETAFRMEIGDRTIPNDFYEWAAEEVIENVRLGQIGAYHVSIWIYNELAPQSMIIQELEDVVRTGAVNGNSVVPACDVK